MQIAWVFDNPATILFSMLMTLWVRAPLQYLQSPPELTFEDRAQVVLTMRSGHIHPVVEPHGGHAGAPLDVADYE